MMRLLFGALLCWSVNCHADFAAALNDKSPLTFEASGGLEWNRPAQTYQALGGVTLKKGTLTVNMNQLNASHFKNGNIRQITAKGAVKAFAGGDVLQADKIVYLPTAEQVVLSGNVYLHMPQQGHSLRTAGSVTYSQKLNTIVAAGTGNGRPSLLKNKTRLTANNIIVTLKQTGGKTRVQNAKATGNVVIETLKEQISGQAANYNSQTQLATLTGNVIITRDANKIKGTKASVNLATGVSTLVNNTGNGRVTGVLQLP